MPTTIPIAARTLPDGVTTIPETNIPTGKTGATLTLDVGHMVAGQNMRLVVEVWDLVQWTGFFSDFDGPWHDKQGNLHTDSALDIGFGVSYPNGVPTPRTSQPGWKVRGSITVTNGPVQTDGGTLVIQP